MLQPDRRGLPRSGRRDRHPDQRLRYDTDHRRRPRDRLRDRPPTRESGVACRDRSPRGPERPAQRSFAHRAELLPLEVRTQRRGHHAREGVAGRRHRCELDFPTPPVETSGGLLHSASAPPATCTLEESATRLFICPVRLPPRGSQFPPRQPAKHPDGRATEHPSASVSRTTEGRTPSTGRRNSRKRVLVGESTGIAGWTRGTPGRPPGASHRSEYDGAEMHISPSMPVFPCYRPHINERLRSRGLTGEGHKIPETRSECLRTARTNSGSPRLLVASAGGRCVVS